MTPTEHPLSRRARRLALLAAAAASLQLAGCATGTHATGAWQEPRTAHAPFRNVLVVGVSPNSRMRRSFEQQMTDEIKAGGTGAIESVFVASELNAGPPTRETVEAMVRKTGVDAVLVTRLVSRTAKAGRTEETADVKIGPQIEVVEDQHGVEVYAGNYSIERQPGAEIVLSDAQIESVLYDVADNGRAVYKVAVESKFRETDTDVIADVAAKIVTAIAGELRGEGLLR